MKEWIDAHAHAMGDRVGILEELIGIEERYGYTHSNFLSVEAMDRAEQNALAIAYKLLSPNHYAFGGLHHRFAYPYEDEMLRLWEIGLDGIKMIENKPTERFRLQIPQDDPSFDRMYGLAEEKGIPFLIHVNDPRTFWSGTEIPKWAEEAGFFYGDPGYPAYEQILAESLRVAEKHPALKVCFAHVLFLSDDRDRLSGIMDKYPSIYLDVTAGTEMYYHFSSDRKGWRQFFLDYRDRIIYGTDNCAPMQGNDLPTADVLNHLEQRFFCTGEEIPLWGDIVQGLELPEDVFEQITVRNFRRFAGERPKAIDRKKAAVYLEKRMNEKRFRLTDTEQAVTETVLSDCLI